MSTRLRSQTIFLITPLLLINLAGGCSFLDYLDGPFLTDHDIGISNLTAEDIYLSYTSENRLIDNTGHNSVVDFILIDTSIVVPAHRKSSLVQRQFDDYQRFGLDYTEIKELFTRLEIYRIEGNDTLFARPDLMDEQKWEYFNSDPLPFSDEIYHTYLLRITDEDFE